MDSETLKTLFASHYFRIPDYQRGYAWGSEQRNALLEDLEETARIRAGANSTYEHFTGIIVLTNKDSKPIKVPGGEVYRIDVVDGQQRLTTLVILLKAIIDEFRKLGGETDRQIADALERQFIKAQSGGDYCLKLNDDSINRFFIDSVLESRDLIRSPKVLPEENIWGALGEFRHYFEQKRDEMASDFRVFLETLSSIITSNLRFLVHAPATEAAANYMFESLNARGLQLTQLEKTKNLLFLLGYKFCEDDAQRTSISQSINDTWKEIWRDLYQTSGRGDEDQFLRAHWTVFEGDASYVNDDPSKTSDVHQAIRITMKERKPSSEQGREWTRLFLQSLREYSPIYRDVVCPTLDKSFANISASNREVRESASRIQRIDRAAGVIPLMMAAVRTYGNHVDSLLEVLRLIEVLGFRLWTVGRRADAGRGWLASIARDIARGELPASSAIRQLQDVIQEYCNDDRFRAALYDTTDDFYDWGGTRFLLFEYEYDLRKQYGMEVAELDWNRVIRDRPEQSVEHVLPQGEETPSSMHWQSYWKEHFTEEQWKHYRHCLGNLNLAMAGWNSSYSNRGFPEKRGTSESNEGDKVYWRSTWQCEQELRTLDDWTPEQIEARQKRLADWATRRWPIHNDEKLKTELPVSENSGTQGQETATSADNGNRILTINKVLDASVETEGSDAVEYDSYDEAFWIKSALWANEIAKALLSVVQPIFPKAELHFVKSYITIAVNKDQYFWIYKRAANKCLIVFWVGEKLIDSARALLDSKGIPYTVQDIDVVQITTDKKLLEENTDVYKQLGQMVQQAYSE